MALAQNSVTTCKAEKVTPISAMSAMRRAIEMRGALMLASAPTTRLALVRAEIILPDITGRSA
jgi:hypothetical protein